MLLLLKAKCATSLSHLFPLFMALLGLSFFLLHFQFLYLHWLFSPVRYLDTVTFLQPYKNLFFILCSAQVIVPSLTLFSMKSFSLPKIAFIFFISTFHNHSLTFKNIGFFSSLSQKFCLKNIKSPGLSVLIFFSQDLQMTF